MAEIRGPSTSEHDLELEEQLGLVELVNRVLDRGVVITGEVTVTVAGVDLIYLGLRLVLTSVESARRTTPLGVGRVELRARPAPLPHPHRESGEEAPGGTG